MIKKKKKQFGMHLAHTFKHSSVKEKRFKCLNLEHSHLERLMLTWKELLINLKEINRKEPLYFWFQKIFHQECKSNKQYKLLKAMEVLGHMKEKQLKVGSFLWLSLISSTCLCILILKLEWKKRSVRLILKILLKKCKNKLEKGNI